jgi:hypothetical protein
MSEPVIISRDLDPQLREWLGVAQKRFGQWVIANAGWPRTHQQLANLTYYIVRGLYDQFGKPH